MLGIGKIKNEYHVIMVHGTFAAQEDNVGNGWWQRTGLVEKYLVNTINGKVHFHPFQWSGKNTQSERSKASKKLSEKLSEFQEKKYKYIVIGHSHGGTVLWYAINDFYRHTKQSIKDPLSGLLCWVTVGTPFLSRQTLKGSSILEESGNVFREIKSQKYRDIGPMAFFFSFAVILATIFEVATTFWKYIFAVASVVYCAAIVFTRLTTPEYFSGNEYHFALFLIAPLVVYLFLIALLYVVGIVFDLVDRFAGSIRHKSKIDEKWIGLSHPKDEAIALLGAARKIKMNLFSKAFVIKKIDDFARSLVAVCFLIYSVCTIIALLNLATFKIEGVYLFVIYTALGSSVLLVFAMIAGITKFFFTKYEKFASYISSLLNRVVDGMAQNIAYGDDMFGGTLESNSSPKNFESNSYLELAELGDSVEQSIEECLVSSQSDVAVTIRNWLHSGLDENISILKPIKLLEGTSAENTEGLIHNNYFRSEKFLELLAEKIRAHL